MSGPRLRAFALILSLLGGLIYLALAALEVKNSRYHAVLAVVLAVLMVVAGRQEPAGLWGLFVLIVLIGYGIVRLWSDLHAVVIL